jgi:hypothetical protein
VVALAVISHRLELRPEQDHLNKKEVLRSLLKDLPVPVA